MKHYYCTIVSRKTLAKSLLLYESMLKYDENFCVYFICMQDELKKVLEEKTTNSVIVLLSDIEKGDPDFYKTKSTRTDKEYAWTAKAPVLLYLFKNYKEMNQIVYLDADVCLLGNPKKLFNECNGFSIFLTRERFFIEDNFERYQLNGYFNAGCIAFRRDDHAMACLGWLRDKCIEWCYNKIEKGLYGDQKYLDEIPIRFNQVGISRNMGINVTPWYAHASIIDNIGDTIYLNDTPIICYHFSGLITLNESEYDLCMYVNLSGNLIQKIYLPYIRKLRETYKSTKDFGEEFNKNANKDIIASSIRNYMRL